MRVSVVVFMCLAVFAATLWYSQQRTNSVSTARAEQDNSEPPQEAIAPEPKTSDFLNDPVLFPKFLTQKSSCEFADTPLADAIQFLATQHEFDHFINETTLRNAGVPLDSKVTLTISSESDSPLTLEEVLELTLEPLQLAWHFDGVTLIVTTRDDLNSFSRWITRQYDLTDSHDQPRHCRACTVRGRPTQHTEIGVEELLAPARNGDGLGHEPKAICRRAKLEGVRQWRATFNHRDRWSADRV